MSAARFRSAAVAEPPGFELPKRLARLPGYHLADIPPIKARLRAEGKPVIDLGVGDTGDRIDRLL